MTQLLLTLIALVGLILYIWLDVYIETKYMTEEDYQSMLKDEHACR